MKKLLGFFAGAALVALLAGCKTTQTEGSGMKGGSKSKAGSKTYQIVNYQGATFGSEVPQWVILVNQGQYSQSVLKPVMPGLEGKKVFVTLGRGDNRDFVESWTNAVQIETEVSGAMERVTGKAVTATMTGASSQTGASADPTELQKNLNDFRMAVQTVRLSGLEKIASYWVEIEVTEKKQVIDSYYEYYAVWAIDEKLYDRQLDAAMKQIDSTSSETEALKKIVQDKLRETLAISNDAATVEAADEYIVYAE